MVEGHGRFALPLPDLHCSLLTNFDYSDHDGFDILHHGSGGNAERGYMLGFQEIGSCRIGPCRGGTIMRLPIDFDRQPNRGAIEIENVDARRMLPTILETTGS
jgi:hypothetical protein